MGFNGTFLCVSDEGRDVAARLPDAIERFFLSQGASLVTRSPLGVDEWEKDPCLFGIAIASAVSGWIGIVDTEGTPSRSLARALAARLETPVVISCIAEICDPPAPESISVFGAPIEDRFYNRYELVGFRYRHLVQGSIDGVEASFLTFRGAEERSHSDDFTDVGGDFDIPF